MQAARKIISVDFEVFGKVQGSFITKLLMIRCLVPKVHSYRSYKTESCWMVYEYSSRDRKGNVDNYHIISLIECKVKLKMWSKCVCGWNKRDLLYPELKRLFFQMCEIFHLLNLPSFLSIVIEVDMHLHHPSLFSTHIIQCNSYLCLNTHKQTLIRHNTRIRMVRLPFLLTLKLYCFSLSDVISNSCILILLLMIINYSNNPYSWRTSCILWINVDIEYRFSLCSSM